MLSPSSGFFSGSGSENGPFAGGGSLSGGTRARAAYGAETVSERHRHRYEFNNDYLPQMEHAGLVASGRFEEHDLVEIVELADHPWYVGVQFHPEFKSKPTRPHPLFTGFIGAALAHQRAGRGG